jgi:hypothetical protein
MAVPWRFASAACCSEALPLHPAAVKKIAASAVQTTDARVIRPSCFRESVFFMINSHPSCFNRQPDPSSAGDFEKF